MPARKPKTVSTKAASPAPRPPRWLLALAGAYLVLLALVTLGNTLGPDTLWLTCLNLYLPQWIWALPGVPVLGLFLWKSRRWAWLPALGLLWVFVPLMGFRWRLFTPAADPNKGRRIRVMTYNIKALKRDTDAVLNDLAQYDPDLILLQESDTSRTQRILERLPANWTVMRNYQYTIASRLPLEKLEPDPDYRRYAGPIFMRSRLLVGKTPVTVYSVHLLSPRGGLNALRWQRTEGADNMLWNAKIRVTQARYLRNVLREETGPVLLGGDLNASMASLVMREMEQVGLRDAFHEGGRGYGYTYGHTIRAMRHSYLRIDHLLVTEPWRVLNCWTGNGAGADHRPVFADLYLPETP